MPQIALFQMTTGVDPEANFAVISNAANEAKAGGAQVLFTPEMSLLLDRKRKRAARTMADPLYGEYEARLAQLSGDVGIDLALGSMPVVLPDGQWANRSVYFQSDGEIAAHYDKIHMFDVELATGESWRESAAYRPGDRLGLVQDMPLGQLGMTVCYDLRFPALFGALGNRRCDVIAVPAAFTRPTGEAHWHIMLRARAIEASAFVIAAAQVGEHEDGRTTYGHSLVVDPWGEVLLDMGGEDTGVGFCEINLERITEVRKQIPSLANRREIPN